MKASIAGVWLCCAVLSSFMSARAASITGTVTGPDGLLPLANIEVQTYRWNGSWWDWASYVFTDSSGQYEVGGLAAGTYRVTFSDWVGNYVREIYDNIPGDDYYNNGANIVVPEGGTVSGINASLAIASKIAGTVTGPDGSTLLVNIGVHAYRWNGSWWEYISFAYTDASGQYEVGGLAAGTYRVTFSDETGNYVGEVYDNISGGDYNNSGANIVVPETGTVSGINASLTVVSKITGTVTGPDGSTPLANIDVWTYAWDGSWVDWTSSGHAESDASGQYAVGGLAAGTYFVWVYDDGGTYVGAESYVEVPETGTVSGINFSLVRYASLGGTVTRADGLTPISGVKMRLLGTLNGDVVQTTRTDGNGAYSFTSVRPGNYTVRAEPSASDGCLGQWYGDVLYVPRQDTPPPGATVVTLGSGASEANIVFALDPAGRITGTVSGTGGIPIVGGRVKAKNGTYGLAYGGQTDASGMYDLKGLLPGTYTIKAEADLFQDEWWSGEMHENSANAFPVGSGDDLSKSFDLASGQSPALVEVTSEPSGAAIYLDCQATTNVTPSVLNVGEVGDWDEMGYRIASHVITVKKAGRPRPAPQTAAAIEAETVNLHFDMTSSASGSVSVATTPAGASVFVDYADSAAGMTPLVVGDLAAAGSHVILLKKAGYLQPRPVVVWVEQGFTNEVVVPMTPNTAPGRIIADVHSVPTGSTIYVDYLPATNVTDAIVDWMDPTSSAGSGTHTIMLRKPGFLPMAPRYVDDLTNVTQSMTVNLADFSNAVPAVSRKINCGGTATGSWEADGSWTMSSDGGADIFANAIANAGDVPQAVYQARRYGQTVTYSLAIPDGTYNVRLHFAELYWTAAGKKRFNVTVEGNTVLTNLDLFVAAGGKNIAMTKTFENVAVSGGLQIQGVASVGSAQFNGIEVWSAGSAPGSSLSVAPGNREVSSTAGTATFAVANTGGGTMVYTASEAVSWLGITGGGSGTNGGTITVSYQTNSGTAARTGTVVVTASGASRSPRSVTVVQAARPVLLTIDPASTNHSSAAASGRTLGVAANVAWTAMRGADDPWIKITGGSSGVGNGTVTYSVAANNGEFRSGTITVSGGGLVRTFDVNQAGTMVLYGGNVELVVAPTTLPTGEVYVVTTTVRNTGANRWTAAIAGSSYYPSYKVIFRNMSWTNPADQNISAIMSHVEAGAAHSLSRTLDVSRLLPGSYSYVMECQYHITVSSESYLDMSNSPCTNTFTIVGTTPVLTVTPASLPFGLVTINTTNLLAFTVQNTGGGALTGNVGGVSAPFSIIGSTNYVLSGGVTTTVTVRLAPTATGTYSNNVAFNSNVGNLLRPVTGTATNPPSGMVQFAANAYRIVENGGVVTATVVRVGGSFGSVSATYATSNGTALAGAGLDYTATNGMLSWANGDIADKPIVVLILNDTTYESNETFTVRLSGTALGSPTSAVVTIVNDDPGPRPEVQDDASFGMISNRFGFNINWASGRVVVVDASTNLTQTNWVPLTTGTLVGVPYYFFDPKWTNHIGRFYRIRSP